jgi:hypothetical protein
MLAHPIKWPLFRHYLRVNEIPEPTQDACDFPVSKIHVLKNYRAIGN